MELENMDAAWTLFSVKLLAEGMQSNYKHNTTLMNFLLILSIVMKWPMK